MLNGVVAGSRSKNTCINASYSSKSDRLKAHLEAGEEFK